MGADYVSDVKLVKMHVFPTYQSPLLVWKLSFTINAILSLLLENTRKQQIVNYFFR